MIRSLLPEAFPPNWFLVLSSQPWFLNHTPDLPLPGLNMMDEPRSIPLLWWPEPDAHPGLKPIFPAGWTSELPCEPWELWSPRHSLLKVAFNSITPECGSFFHHHWKSKPVPVCSLSPLHGDCIFIRSFEILLQWAFCSTLSNQWPYTGSVFSAIYPKSTGCTPNPHFNHAFASGFKKKITAFPNK